MSHNRRPFKNNSRFKNSRSHFKNFHNQQSKEYVHKNQLSEIDVGISEYLSKSEGFSGIIKARFSDFQVNEIDLDGKIAKLTDTLIPKDFNKQTNEKPLKEVLESPLEEIPQSIWDSVLALVKSTGDEVVELNTNNLSKEERSKIHDCIRTNFSGKLMSNTIIKDGKSVMHFKKYNPNTSKNRNQFKWPEDKGEYVHFLVYKETLDTLEASLLISDSLKMSASNFNYAGVKDKRAKTTQWFSVRKVEPWKLIVKTKSIRNIRIGNITFKDNPLKLGQLSGNHFRIALRNVIGSDDIINESLNNLKDKGFINYYGLQRFGNDKEIPTFSIGVQLMLGNWKEACDIILKPTESSDPDCDIYKAKKIYLETGDAKKALEQFQRHKNRCIEAKLLLGLSKSNVNDYVNALECIPRNMRLLYLHSFQSLVWNRVVSRRITQFGLDPVDGDLVLMKDSNINCEENDSSEDDSETKIKQEVKVLKSDDCKNYTIYDVVLPLPGYDVVYPEHLKDFYKEILESYGLTLEMTKQKVLTYTLSGNYRKLLGQVQDFSWKIMHYNDPNYNLIRSDLEELRGEAEPKDIEDGQYKALILEFSLNSAFYATMVLREILKTDTSSSSHAKLNNYHKSNEVTNSTKKILISSVSNQEEVSNTSNGHKSLLNDSEGYEAFKNLIFNTNGSQEKREIELDENNADNNKKKLKIN